MKKRELDELAGKYLRMLIYGKPGSGKSTLAYSSTLDKRSLNVLAIDCIGNPGSVYGIAGDVTIVQLDTIKDFNIIQNFIATNQPSDHPFRKLIGIDSKIRYNTLIIDSLTELQSLMLNGITGADKLGIGDDRPFINQNQFGKLLGQTLSIVKTLMEMPINVIFTALEEEIKNEAGAVIGNDIMLIGKAKTQIPGFFHTVGRTITFNKFPSAYQDAVKKEAISLNIKLEPTTNIVMFAQLGKFEAKDQGKPKLPDFIILPTITDILDVRNYKET